MKYVIVIMGGAVDRPHEALAGKTPLQAARAPALARMGDGGRLGQAQMLSADVEPGADAAVMSLLGYDPARRYPGRAPLTAAGLGLDVPDGAWAMHLSLISAPHGTIDAYDDQALPAAEAQAVMQDLLPTLELPGAVVHPTPGAMHLLIDHGREEADPDAPAPTYRDWSPVVAAPPGVVLGQPFREHLPVGDVPGQRLQDLIARSSVALKDHGVNAAGQELGEPAVTHLWPWGLGQTPTLRPWAERFGKSAALISDDPAARGVATLAGLDALQPPTGDSIKGNLIRLCTDAIDAINLYDLVIVHASPAQTAGLDGNIADKVHAIHLMDEHLLQPIAQSLAGRGEHRLMATPLHATPADDQRDQSLPTPFVITGYKMQGVVPRRVTEADADACDLKVPYGHELMEYFLRSGVRG